MQNASQKFSLFCWKWPFWAHSRESENITSTQNFCFFILLRYTIDFHSLEGSKNTFPCSCKQTNFLIWKAVLAVDHNKEAFRFEQKPHFACQSDMMVYFDSINLYCCWFLITFFICYHTDQKSHVYLSCRYHAVIIKCIKKTTKVVSKQNKFGLSSQWMKEWEICLLQNPTLAPLKSTRD